MMQPYQMTEEQYRTLLSFVGYGDFANADIIVFGNEEHADGYSIEANVTARTNLFGRSDDGSFLHRINFDDENYVYYESSVETGRQKIQTLHALEEPNTMPLHPKLSLLDLSLARLVLSLERTDDGDWFSGADQAEQWAQVKTFASQQLFCPRATGIRTAITDWKPLPRNKADQWYSVPYGAIADHYPNAYSRAFDKPLRKAGFKTLESSFSNFYEDMKQRALSLKQVFEQSSARVVLCLGGSTGFKKDALELMYGRNIFQEMTFQNVDMYNANGQKLTALYADVTLPTKSLRLLLVPFPEAGTIFKTQQDALQMLRELSANYIKPLF